MQKRVETNLVRTRWDMMTFHREGAHPKKTEYSSLCRNNSHEGSTDETQFNCELRNPVKVVERASSC